MNTEKEREEPAFDYAEWEFVTLEQVLSDAQKKWPGILPTEIVIGPKYNCHYQGDDIMPYMEVGANDAYWKRVNPQA
jgi:hypothetical protein